MELLSSCVEYAQQNPATALALGVGAAAFLYWTTSSSVPKRKPAPVLIKDPKPGVVYLFQFPPVFGRNPSPFCYKLETYLRAAEIPFEIVKGDHYFKSATQKLPFVQIGNQAINDSGIIIEHLKQNFKDIDASLTPEQKAQSLAFKRMIEDHLYFIAVYFRWVYEPVAKVWLPQAMRGVPALIRGFVCKYAQNGVKRDLWSQGVARYTDEQKLQLARDDLSALSSFLGSKKTFFDDGQVHELDIVVYTMLSNYLLISLHTPLTDVIKEFSNLCEFAERMDKKFLQK